MRLGGIVKGKKDMKSSFLLSFYIGSFKWVLTPVYKNVWQMYKNMLSNGKKCERSTL